VLTRRSLFARGLAAGGAVLLERTGAASALGTASSVFEMSVPAGSFAHGRVTPELRAPQAFDLLAVEWSSPAAARVELRARHASGVWTPWVAAPVSSGHGPDGGATRLITEPVWTGKADAFQLRSSAPLRGARVHFVHSSDDGLLLGAAASKIAKPVLAAGPGQPRILARKSWAGSGNRPSTAPGYGEVQLAFIHHTETANAYSAGQVPAMIRSIFHFHRDVRGWHDIGYNFLVDKFGRIWEGRLGGIDEPVVGAQAGGYNLVSTGVALLGSYQSHGASPAALEALARLTSWKLALHGVHSTGTTVVHVDPAGASFSRFPANAPVKLKRISGHRDADSTDCPGNSLYRRLPRIRSRAAALAPRVASCTISGAAAQATFPSPIPVEGLLSILGGGPIANAEIEVQRRGTKGEQTLAEAVTDANGHWSATVVSPQDAALRALYRGGGANLAVVSPKLYVAVAPAITLQTSTAGAAPGTPVQVSGQVQPAKSVVHVVVSRQEADGTSSQVSSKKVRTSGGSFATTVQLNEPGQYAIVAHTDGDSRNAPGASAPVALTIG
jgi:hypothetical protein